MKQIKDNDGQNVIEYMLLFGVVLMVIFFALSPKTGFFTSHLENSLELSMEGIECMPTSVCYDPNGCLPFCGDGCCQESERASGTCLKDCHP